MTMKFLTIRKIATLALLLFACSTMAKAQIFEVESQESSVYYDGTPYSFSFFWGSKEDKKPRNRSYRSLEAHWTGLGMSFMSYDDNVPNSALKQSRSHAFSFNMIGYKKQFSNSKMLLVSGIGLDWHRYHFDSQAYVQKIDGVTQFVPLEPGLRHKDSKMLAYYVTFPLLLEYHLSPNSIYISGGVQAFLKCYSKSQVEYYDENDGYHRRFLGHGQNLRPIDFKCRFQVGLRGISAFGYYSLTSMFRNNADPDLKMWSVGVHLHL